MRTSKLYIVLGLMLAFGMFFELVAHADDMNESTKITFSAPVEIPGQVLPAGTYVFQQADPNSDLNLVQIYNADHTLLYATVQTVAAERTHPTAHTAITLAEPESGNPNVLVKWFYPGRVTGHEFVYPKQEEQQLAQARQETFAGGHLMPSVETAGE